MRRALCLFTKNMTIFCRGVVVSPVYPQVLVQAVTVYPQVLVQVVSVYQGEQNPQGLELSDGRAYPTICLFFVCQLIFIIHYISCPQINIKSFRLFIRGIQLSQSIIVGMVSNYDLHLLAQTIGVRNPSYK